MNAIAWAGFWLGLGIAVAGFCLACGIETHGKQIKRGLRSLAATRLELWLASDEGEEQ